MKKILLLNLLFPLFLTAQFDLNLNQIASGYERPCELVNAGDERLFVVQQPGAIDILYPDGTQEGSHFLDIESSVQSNGFEQGLLGLAFAPDYCTSGEFYVNYTTTEGGDTYTRISRFSVNPDDPNDALENSEEVILQFEQDFGNHNGGQILFGPDGYLYIATGDGGSGGDPLNRAQDIMSYLGKLLRIDVSTDPYSIPETNPFAFDDFGLDEIWAFGLRNPWKMDFDPETGDLYIGDVGQGDWEEVNFQPADSEGGENYGWRCYEGNAPYNLSGSCSDITNEVYPVLDYNHQSVGNGSRCSVTGGKVYRGQSFPSLQGRYIFTDWCSGEYWVLWQEFNIWQSFLGANLSGSITSFGSDVWGELYAVNGSQGTVSQVVEGDGEFLPHILFDGGTTLESLLDGDSFTWFLNGVEIEGADSQSIEISETGTYTVQITTESGCVITSSELEVLALNTILNDVVEVFELFPNPSSNLVNINLQLNTSNSTNYDVRLFDGAGRKVYEINALNYGIQTIDLSNLTKGAYIIQISDKNGSYLIKSKVILQ